VVRGTFAHGEQRSSAHRSSEHRSSEPRNLEATALTEPLTPELAAQAESVWRSANLARLAALGIPPGLVAEQDDLVAQRLAGGAFGVVAIDRGELVAVALALEAIEDDGKGTEPVPGLMHVSTVAVVPERWGQHLGEIVLEDVLDEGRRRGYERAQLWTHESNLGAQRLYERTGWTPSGRTTIDARGEAIRHYVLDLAGHQNLE
jgi:GNAT superfamily N-acetyltransferase